MFGWIHSTLDFIEEKVQSAYDAVSFWRETESGEPEIFDEPADPGLPSPEAIFSDAEETTGDLEAEAIGDIEAEAELSPYEVEALQEQMRQELDAQIAEMFIEPEEPKEEGPDTGLGFLDDEPPDPDDTEPDLPALKPGDIEEVFGLDEYRQELASAIGIPKSELENLTEEQLVELDAMGESLQTQTGSDDTSDWEDTLKADDHYFYGEFDTLEDFLASITGSTEAYQIRAIEYWDDNFDVSVKYRVMKKRGTP